MIQWDINGAYPLVICYSSPWKPWPIEIDGLPIDFMVIFHGKLKKTDVKL